MSRTLHLCETCECCSLENSDRVLLILCALRSQLLVSHCRHLRFNRHVTDSPVFGSPRTGSTVRRSSGLLFFNLRLARSPGLRRAAYVSVQACAFQCPAFPSHCPASTPLPVFCSARLCKYTSIPCRQPYRIISIEYLRACPTVRCIKLLASADCFVCLRTYTRIPCLAAPQDHLDRILV